MSIADKKKQSLMKRRKRAIILSAVAVVLLAIALFFVLDYVDTITFTDPADGTNYYIRKKDDVYGLYDADRNLLPIDDALSNDAQRITCYVTRAGTLVQINRDDGTSTIYAILDTEGNEVQGVNFRIQMFPRVEKKNILSIEIHNDTGSYTFVRYNAITNQIDKNADFVIRSSPLTTYDQELFGIMYVTAGYTLTLEKLTDPIKDENGEFSEYGLVPETRIRTVDEEGEKLETPEEYLYEPAYYILTDVNGVRHKVIVGDALVTGEGYYVQYVEMNGDTETKRSAVYVMDNDVGKTLLAPIEDYVTPLLSYPMKSTDYIDVEDFTINRKGEDGYERLISFSYVDIGLRENTILASAPYVLDMELNGYLAADNEISKCLRSIYEPSIKQVCVLTPTDEEMVKYGLYKKTVNEEGKASYENDAAYLIGFKYDITDDENKYLETIYQIIMISKPNEDGNYYAFTQVNSVKNQDGVEVFEPSFTYDMIVEVEAHTFEFLNWERSDWINKSYIQTNIAFMSQIKLESAEYSATFDLDNSMTEGEAMLSTNLTVSGTDSLGHNVKTFGKMTVTDVNGYLWVISPNDLQVYNSVTGKELEVASAVRSYQYNALGKQVLCRTGVIDCADYDVEVTANAVNILYNGSATIKESIVRYDTSLFRDYYSTFTNASIMDSYSLTEEEEKKLIEDPDQHLLTLTMTTKDADGTIETKVFRFYQLSGRKAYITVNGNGGFYVRKDRVEKFISDAQKFFNLEAIDPLAKN